MQVNEILVGDALERLKELPDEFIHCCVSSPPYWGLRDYGTAVWEAGDPSCDHKRHNVRPDHSGRTITGRGLQTSSVSSATPYKMRCLKCGALRMDSQIGLEGTPEEYVAKIVEVFREVRRVLRQDGTLWLVMGDCYATGAGKVGECPGGGEQGARWRGDVDRIRDDKRGYRGDRLANGRGDQPSILRNKGNGGAAHSMGPITQPNRMPVPGLKPKDLVGMPWRVAFALQADGWYLRSAITWCKVACMPESVEDRPTSATEQVFLLAKSERYFYDHMAVRETAAASSIARISQPSFLAQSGGEKDYANGMNSSRSARKALENFALNPGRNMRNYWVLGPECFPDAHFAVFPREIPSKAILAGTSEGGCCADCRRPRERMIGDKEMTGGPGAGNKRRFVAKHGEKARLGTHMGSSIPWKPSVVATTGWATRCGCATKETIPAVVLDPFLGSGTTALVALQAGRTFIGIELNPEYAKMAEARIWQEKNQARLV